MFLLGRKGGLNCEVILLAEAALPHSTALLCSPTNPIHLPTTLAVQAAPEFYSNETNMRKIPHVVIQVILNFNAEGVAPPLSLPEVSNFKGGSLQNEHSNARLSMRRFLRAQRNRVSNAPKRKRCRE